MAATPVQPMVNCMDGIGFVGLLFLAVVLHPVASLLLFTGLAASLMAFLGFLRRRRRYRHGSRAGSHRAGP